MPWEPDGPSFGFGAAEPWLPQPEEWSSLAASVQVGDPDSTLELYRRALRLRREHLVGGDEVEWLDLRRSVLGLRRDTGTACVVNFRKSSIELPAGDVLLTSVPLDADGGLPSDAAAWIATT